MTWAPAPPLVYVPLAGLLGMGLRRWVLGGAEVPPLCVQVQVQVQAQQQQGQELLLLPVLGLQLLVLGAEHG